MQKRVAKTGLAWSLELRTGLEGWLSSSGEWAMASLAGDLSRTKVLQSANSTEVLCELLSNCWDGDPCTS